MEPNNNVVKELAIANAENVSHGMSEAFAKFLVKHQVDVTPTKKVKSPALEFVSLLTSEFSEDKAMAAKYPLKDSLFAKIIAADKEAVPALMSLLVQGDKKNFERLGRVIGYAETLKFLDDNKQEILKVMEEIRAEDAFILPDKKLDL